MNDVPLRSFDVISLAYRHEQMRLHSDPRGYGGKGRKWADAVIHVRSVMGASSVLDYGCGQGSLAKALHEHRIDCREYDPAIAGKDRMPGFADLVVSTDVLEHVEPEKLADVLNHIGLLARKAIFVVIALDESTKVLSDGRQAHINLHPAVWWEAKLDEHQWIPVDVDLPNHLSQTKRWKRFVGVFRPPCLP